MKKLLILNAFLFCGFLGHAQFIDVSQDRGCIWRYQGSSAKCYKCTQPMPDGDACNSSFLPCPECWTMVFSHHDHELQSDIFNFTIEPYGVQPETIQVYNVSFLDEADGRTIFYEVYQP